MKTIHICVILKKYTSSHLNCREEKKSTKKISKKKAKKNPTILREKLLTKVGK
jgi:hypothetical protein